MRIIKLKIVLIFVIGFIQVNQLLAQDFSSDCDRNSLKTLEVEKKLEELSCQGEGFDEFAKKHLVDLKKNYQRLDEPHYYCDIPAFAKLFDFLLVHGLDLEYDFANDFPMSSSFQIIEPELKVYFDSLRADQEEKNLITFSKRDLFLSFVILNEYYSEKIIPSFEENPDINIEDIISNIKLYGSLSYPNQVANILRGNYRELTKEEFYGLPPKKPKK